MTIIIHNGNNEADSPFDLDEEALLLNTIDELPAEEFWTVHQLFDGVELNGRDEIEKLIAELTTAVCLGLAGEDQLQKLIAYCDNNTSVRLEI